MKKDLLTIFIYITLPIWIAPFLLAFLVTWMFLKIDDWFAHGDFDKHFK